MKTIFSPKTRPLLLALFLSSCAATTPQTMETFRNSAIESAKSDNQNFTREEKLLQHYERSNVEWIDSNKNVVKSYNHSERKLGILSYIPLLSFLLPRNYENYEVIITAKNGTILDVQSFYSIITLESESNCNEAIFSCVTGVK